MDKPRAPLAANSSDTASVQRLTEKAPSRRSLVLTGDIRNVAAPGVGHRLDACRAHDEAGRIDLGGSLRNLDLRALEVADLGAVVGRRAMPGDPGIIVQTGLGISQRHAGKHIGKQRKHRQRIKRVRIGALPGVGPPSRSLTASVICSATKASLTSTSFDPVPRNPVAFQVSLIL